MKNQDFQLEVIKSLADIKAHQEDHGKKLTQLFTFWNDKTSPAIEAMNNHIKHHPSFQKTIMTASATVAVILGLLKLLEYTGVL